MEDTLCQGYPDDIRGSTSDRDRVHSATLKPGIVPPEDMEYMDVNEFLRSYQHSTPIIPVSPLAKKRTKSGWLWKHSGPEGRSPFRKRWAVFDGEELSYYESDTKTDISKGILPVDVMLRLQMPSNSQTIFHLQMKGGRTLIFQAENCNERAMWASTLMAAMLENQQKGASQHKPGGDMSMPYKEGLLKMEGQKIYMAIKGDQAVYYKSKNEFLFAQPIARLPMNLATVKDIANRKFQVVLPYRTFTFSVESEEEKRLWTTSFKDAISEGLSDYQVLNEIWANEANTKCADCGRDYPDWASVNLAIVICKHCAGVHREIGVHNSKVRSLKMDVKIWDPIMKRLLIDIGNGNANRFWSCNLNSADEITDMADKKQRSWFIKAKYIDMGYARDRPEGVNQDLLNESLIEAVRTNNLIEAYHLVFSGADINCYTGKEHAKTPHSLAEHLSYATLAELLRQNGGTEVISPKGHITDRNTSVRKKTSIPKTRSRPPICIRDCLFKFGGDFKSTGEDTKAKGKFNLIMSALQPGDFQKRLCVLENSYLKYCDPEKPNTIKDSLSCNDLISISVYTPEQALKAGYKHCFELSRNSGRTYLFCADHEDTRKRWTQGLFQEVVPVYVQDAVQGEKEYDRVGKVNIKAKKWSKSDTQWSSTWCLLQGKNLHYYHREYTSMETIDLRKLVQITFDHTKETVSTQSNSTAEKESIPIIMLVFREKSYYIRSETKPDTDSWMAALKRADNTSGPTLEDKQLTTEGTPVVLEKCLTYVEQFGIATRGIYRLSGTHSKTSQLLTEFRQNARETQMREGQLNVHDVANALKRWFKSLPGSLLTEPLYDNWIETAQIRQEHYDRKLEWYKHLIDKLPEINKVTLKVLLNHLKKVSSHEKENEMSVHNLAIVFGPTLMQPQADGDSNPQYLSHTSEQIACIEDLLRCYDWLFDVTEIDREKELRMQQAKEKINQAKQQQNMLTTMDYDMMVPVYINKREDRCTNQKVNLKAGELIVKICKAHGYPPEKWGLFEGILDGDAERALHYSEHVLSVIKSWDMPSTNYLVAKNDYIRDKMKWFRQAATSIGETLMEGPLRFYEGKKKWSKVTGHVGKNPQDGIVYFKIVKVQAKTLLSLGVSSFNIYVGVDKKTKPPGSWKQGFTIKQVGETPKYFVAETEGELFRWISHILLSAHPEGFTPPASLESSPSKAQDDVSPYAAISQQELQQAATKVFRKQRTVTGDATEFEHAQYADENFNVDYDPALQATGISSTGKHDSPGMDYGDASYAYDGTNAARHAVAPIPARRPNHINTGYSRQPPLPNALSPVGGPNSIGLGMQLKDELSGVLRKRTQ